MKAFGFVTDPVALRTIFSQLTRDNSSPVNQTTQEIDQRFQFAMLSEDAGIMEDLRHQSPENRPNTFRAFFAVVMSFGSQPHRKKSGDEGVKFSLSQLENSITRFTKVLEIDLDRLHQHQLNIQKFKACEDHASLRREHVNASRTCQQIKSNIRQLEQTRGRLETADLDMFDQRVSQIRMKAVLSVMEFIDHHGDQNNKPTSGVGHPELSTEEGETQETEFDQIQATVQQTTSLVETEDSWNDLENSLVELNSLVQDFSGLVSQQQKTVDEIEDSIDTAHDNVREGVDSLAIASKLKTAMFPVAGALLGGVIGGPVGFLAGMKIGGMAAVGGALTGVGGGLLLKQRQDKITNIEMENLREQAGTEERLIADDLGTVSPPTPPSED